MAAISAFRVNREAKTALQRCSNNISMHAAAVVMLDRGGDNVFASASVHQMPTNIKYEAPDRESLQLQNLMWEFCLKPLLQMADEAVCANANVDRLSEDVVLKLCLHFGVLTLF